MVDLSNLKTYKIYHGSDHIVEKPLFGEGKSDNDYGSGFYTTRNPQKAKEWSTMFGGKDCINNIYEIDTNELNILNLDNYGPLAWIAELTYNRYTISEDTEKYAQEFVKKYKVDTNQADIIVGYRAAGNYMDVIKDFLRGNIDIYEAEKLLKKGNLGTQVFIKSEKAFERIQFLGYEQVTDKDFLKADENLRKEISGFLHNREKQIKDMGYVPQGLLIKNVLDNKFVYNSEYEYLEMTVEYSKEELEELAELERQIALLEETEKENDIIEERGD